MNLHVKFAIKCLIASSITRDILQLDILINLLKNTQSSVLVKVFFIFLLIKNLVKSSETPKKNYSCPVCNEMYTTRFNLRRHANKVHPNNKILEESNRKTVCFL